MTKGMVKTTNILLQCNFTKIHAIVTAQLVLTSRMASQRMMVQNDSLFTERQMAGLAAMT